MKTQEQYASEISEIVKRDARTFQTDWFNTDRDTFMKPGNDGKSFLLATRETGCELLMLFGGSNFNENNINRVLGSLGNTHFYICHPKGIFNFQTKIREITGCQAVKEIQAELPFNWYLLYDVKNNWCELRNLIK